MVGGEKASVLLLDLAAMVGRADEALLPAVYAEMSADLGVGLTALEWITFVRALVQALAAPFAAYLVLRHNRVQIIAAGAAFWAIATASVGISTSYWQARGVAFGWLHGAGQLGTMLAGAFLKRMGAHTVMGIGGWRATFICTSLSSILIGLAIFALGHDPRANHVYSQIGENYHPKALDSEGAEANVEEFIQGSKLVLKVRSFQILVVQGFLGRLSWSFIVLLRPWMHLIGYSHNAAYDWSFIVLLRPWMHLIGNSHNAAYDWVSLVMGSTCGSLAGVWVGDKAARWSPNKGRIICSQFSAGMVISLSSTLLLEFPKDTGFDWTYGSSLFFLGFLISWILPATSWPIFAEVVPEELRTTAFAIDLSVEKFFSAFSTPFVASMARRLFHYSNMKATIEQDKVNSSALGKAFFACISASCVLIILVLFLLYSMYPRDREQAKNVKALADFIRALEMVEYGENDEDRVWDDGWENLDEDDDDLDLSLLLENERLRDQGVT